MTPELKDDGFYHPASVHDVVALVNKARSEGKLLRVKGSGHSVPHAIYPDGFPYREAEYYAPSWVKNEYSRNFQPVKVPENAMPVLLDKMRQVTFLDADLNEIETPMPIVGEPPPMMAPPGSNIQYVKAEAGVHLGQDPYDPTQTSTYFNSLFYIMEWNGFAVPDMGGITHQTVGGFLATGSSGGTLTYSLEEAIFQFTFVDGHGNIRVARRGDTSVVINETINGKEYRWTGDDLFNAVGVSMGLLGIVTEVIFKVEPRYDIIGEENIRPYADYSGWIDFFGTGSNSLATFLRETEYTRILWWPQKGTEKMTVWSARRMKPEDYNKHNSRDQNGKRVLIPKPYKEVTWVLGSPMFFEYLGEIFYTTVANWPRILFQFITFAWLRMFIQSFIETFWYSWLLPLLLKAFVPTDPKDDKGAWQPQTFWDTWWRGLPMDNQMDDRVMGVIFTEIWIPLQNTAAVMNTMKKHYDSNGLSATSTFTAELYATKASSFWMSPAYDSDVFRVDIFLSATDTINPRVYYDQFWELLKPFTFRTHWGKWIPGATDTPEKDAEWRNYLKGNFPRWQEFLDLRSFLDSEQVFVNDYWRKRFDIETLPKIAAVEPLTWDGQEPPHLEKKDHAVRPNQSLLLGWPSLPKPSILVWIVTVATAIGAFFGISYIMTEWLHMFYWQSEEAHIGVSVIFGTFIGIGTVLTRAWSPLLMVPVTIIVVALANLVNSVAGDPFWAWNEILGLSYFWSAMLGELLESTTVPIIAWFVGKFLFKKYWPQ